METPGAMSRVMGSMRRLWVAAVAGETGFGGGLGAAAWPNAVKYGRAMSAPAPVTKARRSIFIRGPSSGKLGQCVQNSQCSLRNTHQRDKVYRSECSSRQWHYIF